MLEIELNESLRRRREELRVKIETLGVAEAGDESAAENLEAKNRELKSLNNSIEALQRKNQGTSRQLLHSKPRVLMSRIQRWRKRWKG